MSVPLVSVVVPVYNRLEYLGDTISSVIAQSLPDWELIVVDDGSSEDVGAVVARHPDPRIRLVRQDNRGNAAARNAGAHTGQGAYVAFLDSDDYWHPHMLARCCATMERTSARDGVAYVRWQVVDAQGRPGRDVVPWRPLSGDLLRPLSLGLPIFPSASIIRRECFNSCGGFDDSLDDWDLWLRVALHGYRFLCIDEQLAYYRVHGANLHSNRQKRVAVHFGTLEKLFTSPLLPANIRALKEQAYSQQHLGFGLMALQQRDLGPASADLVRAFQLDPALLHQSQVYFDIVGSVKRVPAFAEHAGDAESLVDVEAGGNTLLGTLDSLFALRNLPAGVRAAKREAYGRAHYAIGVVDYWFGEGAGASRAHLARSVWHFPSLLRRPESRAHILRALIGKARLQRLRGFRDKAARGWASALPRRRAGDHSPVSQHTGSAAVPLGVQREGS